MAQLKDLLVAGASRFIGDAYANKLQLTSLLAPTSAGGTTYGAGTSGNYLRSNGTSVYWGALDTSGTWSGNAATATALTSNAGSGTQPIYFSGGKPVATSYYLQANIKSYSGSLASGGWAALNGKANSPSIAIAYNSGAAAWNSGTYSASLVFGCSDTRGLLDLSYSTPIVTFGGTSYGGATDDAPKWYFKLSGTSGQTYTFPSSSKTLAATDGTGASGTWGISISGNAATATKLATARTLWGQSFDGSANVNGNMTDVGPQFKLPANQTTFSLLTSTGGAANVNAGKIGMADSYSNINLSDYRFYVHNGVSYFGGNILSQGTIYFGNGCSSGKGILSFSSSYPNYGIWYFDESTDVMTFSAAGNANSKTGADLAIGVHGAGTLAIRNNRVPHTGNTTGTVGSGTQPVYVNAGTITALTYTANRLYYSASTTSFTTTSHYANATKIAINSTSEPSYNLYINGTSYFNGNVTHNGIVYFANGTTYQVNNSGDARFRYVGVGTAAANSSYALNIGGNVYINGIHYFGNGTTYYINNSGTGNLNALTVNSTTNSTSSSTGGLIVSGGIGVAKDIYSAGDILTTNGMRIHKVKIISSETEDQAAGWRRVCTISSKYSYANGIILISGGWNNGAPTLATISVQMRNGQASLKLLQCGFTGRISEVRLIKNATNTCHFDVNLSATTGGTAELYATFFGNITVSDIAATNTVTTDTTTPLASLSLTAAEASIYNGTQWGVAYYSTTKKIVSTAAGTSGYLLQGNGSAAPSWIQATNSNTGSTIVKRDSSGNFSAGTITASLSGNATTATTLATSRTIQTNLASTSSASFNGSANITPGVTGTLAIANGGTGATTVANARANLGTWALVSDSYNTIMPSNGTTNGWYKFGTANTSYGILPSQSGSIGSGHNYIGTSTWFWKYAYIDEIHSSALTTTSCGTAAPTTAPTAGTGTLYFQYGNTSSSSTIDPDIDKVYPVGSIYISLSSANPSTFWGGTWEQITGRFLLGTGTPADNTNTYYGTDLTYDGATKYNETPGSLGGTSRHTLTVAQLPAHTHGSKSLTGSLSAYTWATGSSSGIVTKSTPYQNMDMWGGSTIGHNTYTINATHTHDSVGSGAGHNNMPPYLSVYMWKRTA